MNLTKLRIEELIQPEAFLNSGEVPLNSLSPVAIVLREITQPCFSECAGQDPQGEDVRPESSKTIAPPETNAPCSPDAAVLLERLERVSIRAVAFAGKLPSHSKEQDLIGALLMQAMEIELALSVDWLSLECVMNDLESCMTPVPQAAGKPSSNSPDEGGYV